MIPDFIKRLKSAPRSPNGQHRKPSPPAHGNTLNGTGGITGGTIPVTTPVITYYTTNFPDGTSRPIPYAGIRAGEIIGHRLWWVIPDPNSGGEPRLCSWAHSCFWRPWVPMYGDVNSVVECSFHNIDGGVYAYAAVIDVQKELQTIQPYIHRAVRDFGCVGSWDHSVPFWAPKVTDPTTLVWAYGTVKMWGEIVEHETGYRSEWAKPHSINTLFGFGADQEIKLRLLDALRKTYGVNEKPIEPKPQNPISSGDWTGR